MYGVVHKSFIQAMMCNQILPWNEADKLLSNIAQSHNEDKNIELQSVIDETNNRLRDLKMELRDITCEVTNKRYCALIITVETYVGRLANKYTRNEIQLLNKIMEEIVTSGNGYVYLNTCINFNTKLPEDMSKSNAEAVIRRFLKDHWLIEGDRGMIYLGVRYISEMEPLIREVYGEYVGDCPLCKRLAIVGEKCGSCYCRIHFHCFERYKSGREGVNKCLGCGENWNDSSDNKDD